MNGFAFTVDGIRYTQPESFADSIYVRYLAEVINDADCDPGGTGECQGGCYHARQTGASQTWTPGVTVDETAWLRGGAIRDANTGDVYDPETGRKYATHARP